FARHFQWNTCSPLIAHFAGVVVIRADAETCVRMRPTIDRCRLRFRRVRLRHFVTNRNRAGDGQTRATPVRKEIQGRLCAYFHLTYHVWKKLQRWRGAYLPTKPEHREYCDGAQKKNHEKFAQHI